VPTLLKTQLSGGDVAKGTYRPFDLVALLDAADGSCASASPGCQQLSLDAILLRNTNTKFIRCSVAFACSLMLHLALAALLEDFLPAPHPPSVQQLVVILTPEHSESQAAAANSNHSESPPRQKPVATAQPRKSDVPVLVAPIHEPPTPDSAPTVTSAETPAVRPVKEQVIARPKRQTSPVLKTKSPPPAKKRPPVRSKPPKPRIRTARKAKSLQSLSAPTDSVQPNTTTQSTRSITAKAAQAKLVNRQAALGKQVTHSPKGDNTPPTPVKAAPLPNNPKPLYPLVARKRGFEGRVVLQVTVMINGSATNVQVKTGSGHAQLDRAALEAVRRWRFRPAQRGGKPVNAVLDVPVVFRLRG